LKLQTVSQLSSGHVFFGVDIGGGDGASAPASAATALKTNVRYVSWMYKATKNGPGTEQHEEQQIATPLANQQVLKYLCSLPASDDGKPATEVSQAKLDEYLAADKEARDLYVIASNNGATDVPALEWPCDWPSHVENISVVKSTNADGTVTYGRPYARIRNRLTPMLHTDPLSILIAEFETSHLAHDLHSQAMLEYLLRTGAAELVSVPKARTLGFADYIPDAQGDWFPDSMSEEERVAVCQAYTNDFRREVNSYPGAVNIHEWAITGAGRIEWMHAFQPETVIKPFWQCLRVFDDEGVAAVPAADMAALAVASADEQALPVMRGTITAVPTLKEPRRFQWTGKWAPTERAKPSEWNRFWCVSSSSNS
jgi:hypothetical protein